MSPDGRYVALHKKPTFIVPYIGILYIFDTRDYSLRQLIDEVNDGYVRFSRNNDLILVNSPGMIVSHDIITLNPIDTQYHKMYHESPILFDVSSSGDTLLFYQDKNLILYDVPAEEEKIIASAYYFQDAKFSQNMDYVFYSDTDSTIYIWSDAENRMIDSIAYRPAEYHRNL
ncbi:MAG: hypothetical protein ACLFQX_01310 [Candidatus Kapaibacterium sp.]